MRVVVVGLGSIGKRHLANIREVVPNAEITVLRHTLSDAPKPQGADRVVYELEAALDVRPEVAFICGPTTQHAEAGVAFADAGAHLFVEKPLAATAADAARLVNAAARAGKVLMVGYNLRFLPSLRLLRDKLKAGLIGRAMSLRAEVGQYLPDWRPGTDYRLGNSARSVLGAGIEFELSHEIDYARWLLGEFDSVNALFERTSDLEIEVDDTAEILLHSKEGEIASVHLDMTQRASTRTCRIAGTKGTLIWDGHTGEVRSFTTNDGWTTVCAQDGERNMMYLDEARHLFACVRGDEAPLISGYDGLRVVEIAVAARRAYQEGRRISL